MAPPAKLAKLFDPQIVPEGNPLWNMINICSIKPILSRSNAMGKNTIDLIQYLTF